MMADDRHTIRLTYWVAIMFDTVRCPRMEDEPVCVTKGAKTIYWHTTFRLIFHSPVWHYDFVQLWRRGGLFVLPCHGHLGLSCWLILLTFLVERTWP